MAKRTTVSTGEWAKHLRPQGKREFWKKDRQAGKQAARTQLDVVGTTGGKATVATRQA